MLKGRVALVTGGSAGIGKETVRGLAALGATVLSTGRALPKTEAAAADVRATTGNASVHALAVDLASLDAVRALSARVLSEHRRLDILVLNAGLWTPARRVTADGHEETFAVNHLAHFLLTTLLLDRLVESAPARVVVVSSRLHEREKRFDFDDPMAERGYVGMRAYRQSKLANVMFSRELSRRLSGTGVTSNSLHPGDVATEVTRENWFLHLAMVSVAKLFLLTPVEGARQSIELASLPAHDGVTGQYFRAGRVHRASPAADDDEACRRLWALSEELVATRGA